MQKKCYFRLQNDFGMTAEWPSAEFCLAHRRCKGDGELPRADRADGGAAEQGDQIPFGKTGQKQRPWSVSIPGSSYVKPKTRRRDGHKGMFSMLLCPCPVGTKLVITKQKKTNHLRKQFIIRNPKGSKVRSIQLWSLSTLWWLRAHVSCQKMPKYAKSISKTNTDILKYLEMMVWQLLSFRFCSRNPYIYIHILCVYKHFEYTISDGLFHRKVCPPSKAFVAPSVSSPGGLRLTQLAIGRVGFFWSTSFVVMT